MAEDVVKGIQLVKPVECTIIVQPGNPHELELSGEDFNVVRRANHIIENEAEMV